MEELEYAKSGLEYKLENKNEYQTKFQFIRKQSFKSDYAK